MTDANVKCFLCETEIPSADIDDQLCCGCKQHICEEC